MRICQTSLGWIDMDHVLRVTPVEFGPNPRGVGGYFEFHIFLMMRNQPFTWRGEWDEDERPTQAQRDEANEAMKIFLLQWRDSKGE